MKNTVWNNAVWKNTVKKHRLKKYRMENTNPTAGVAAGDADASIKFQSNLRKSSNVFYVYWR